MLPWSWSTSWWLRTRLSWHLTNCCPGWSWLPPTPHWGPSSGTFTPLPPAGWTQKPTTCRQRTLLCRQTRGLWCPGTSCTTWPPWLGPTCSKASLPPSASRLGCGWPPLAQATPTTPCGHWGIIRALRPPLPLGHSLLKAFCKLGIIIWSVEFNDDRVCFISRCHLHFSHSFCIFASKFGSNHRRKTHFHFIFFWFQFKLCNVSTFSNN